jgi:hypothetical protein
MWYYAERDAFRIAESVGKSKKNPTFYPTIRHITLSLRILPLSTPHGPQVTHDIRFILWL